MNTHDGRDPKVMVCFIGEQNAPNLIPILHYDHLFGISEVVMFYSEGTKRRAESLKSVLNCPAMLCKVENPYAIERIHERISTALGPDYQPEQLIFNLTGGTKPMSLACYQAAQERPRCMPIYLQSEGGRSLCYEYLSQDGALAPRSGSPVEIGGVLDIEAYLCAHGLLGWIESPPPEADFDKDGYKFERAIGAALREGVDVDEKLPNMRSPGDEVEIDWLVRRKNQIGAIQAKAAGEWGQMAGLKQSVTYAEPRYLGTYVKRMLVLDSVPVDNVSALAKALNIRVIPLLSFKEPDFRSKGLLSDADQETLRREVNAALGS